MKAAKKQVHTQASSATEVRLQLQLDSYEVYVESEPAGATILAGGQTMGRTPMRVHLPTSVKQVSLRMHCYDDVDVDVGPGGTPQVNEKLKKQRGCR